MQTITVKRFKVTNTKPVRFQAVAYYGCKGPVLSEHALGGASREENCKLAAAQLAISLGWKGRMIGGDIGGVNGGCNMLFVFDDPSSPSFEL